MLHEEYYSHKSGEPKWVLLKSGAKVSASMHHSVPTRFFLSHRIDRMSSVQRAVLLQNVKL